MSTPGNRQICPSKPMEGTRIMAQGLVIANDAHPNPGQITRGMAVISSSGEDLGRVAALLLDSQQEKIICLILGHLPQEGGYQSLPITWIDRISEDSVTLSVGGDIVQQLPNWHSQ